MIELEYSEIKTKRLLLRSFNVNDLENVFKGLSDPDVIKYYGISYQTLASAKEQMLFFKDLETAKTGKWWAICSLDNKIFFGAGGLNNVCAKHRKGEIGFWLLKDFWGQGIISESIPLICKYGNENLGLHRIEAFVESENLNSKKALANSNFKYEGTMKDCEIKNGHFISVEIFAQLKL